MNCAVSLSLALHVHARLLSKYALGLALTRLNAANRVLWFERGALAVRPTLEPARPLLSRAYNLPADFGERVKGRWSAMVRFTCEFCRRDCGFSCVVSCCNDFALSFFLSFFFFVFLSFFLFVFVFYLLCIITGLD